jgi:hypothetical protein
LNTPRLRRRGPNTSLRFSPAHLIFGGAAFALSAAIVLLVGTVWRISPVENQKPEKPPSPRVLASRALTLAPTTLAVVPPMRLTADSSDDHLEATRPAPAVPVVPVPLVVASETPVATRGVPTAAVGEQSVRKGARTPQLKDLRAGSYVVRLECEGYQRWSAAATVSAVRQEHVKAKLERERSR